MKPLFICYSRCSTCAKAAKWLADHGIDATPRDIAADRPSRRELEEWIRRSGLPVTRFFNTSGMKYRALNLKERIKTASADELLDLLASDGMLVKRPLLVCPDGVLTGFREPEWAGKLL